MNKNLILLLTVFSQLIFICQTTVTVQTGTPISTIEDAYNYLINNNHVNSSMELIAPSTVLIDDSNGPVFLSSSLNNFTWNISGTAVNTLTITSSGCRSTLTRNFDNGGYMIKVQNVNYCTITSINFEPVATGALQFDNCDYCTLSYCSFQGGTPVASVSGAVIWLGVAVGNGYTGVGSLKSEHNEIKYNYIHNLNYLPNGEDDRESHAIYVSNGAHDNLVYSNSVQFASAWGVHFYHADYRDNTISTNLVSKKDGSESGIIVDWQIDTINNFPNANGAPWSIASNIVANNYIYDNENTGNTDWCGWRKGYSYSGNGVRVGCDLKSNGSQEINNHRFNGVIPNDPYWLGYDADQISNRTVTGDFDGDGRYDDIAAFYDYTGGEARIHVWTSMDGDNETVNSNSFKYSEGTGWWTSTSFTASNIDGKVVAGDFNHDGKDDIAAVYKVSSNWTKIFVWLSTGNGFQSQLWWNVSGYNSDKIIDRVVVGDFDGDLYEDDIAAFYDYGNSETRIHVWTVNEDFWGNGVSFNYQSGIGWWSSTGYNADLIQGRVVSGDFDHDGVKNDIAAFYDYGNSETRIHTWRSNGNAFQYYNSSGWWSTTGYDANKITNRVVSGDFDADGRKDDIAAFYDYSNGTSRIHVWQSTGSNLSYSGGQGLWDEVYESSKITNRVVAGDFDSDGKLDDICAFYDYADACGSTRTHVWKGVGVAGSNTNNSFSYVNSSLGFPWMILQPSSKLNLLSDIDSEENTITESSAGSVIVYPNPTSHEIYIDNYFGEMEIKIYNALGQLVKTVKSIDSKIKIDLSDVKTGVLYYEVHTADEVFTGKIIKQ